MRPADEVRRQLVWQWVRKADLDYYAADQLLRTADPLKDIVAFHCQQAAEKYLKALLVYHQLEFPRTHNLRELLDLLSGVAPDIAVALDRAAILTPYGVDIRYPGDFPDVLPGQEQEAFEIACRVREAVLAVLVPNLWPG